MGHPKVSAMKLAKAWFGFPAGELSPSGESNSDIPEIGFGESSRALFMTMVKFRSLEEEALLSSFLLRTNFVTDKVRARGWLTPLASLPLFLELEAIFESCHVKIFPFLA